MEKRDVVFRPGLFNPKFSTHLSELIFKFTQKPNEMQFSNTLESFLLPGISIFRDYSPDLEAADMPPYLITQALEDLIYRNCNSFLIYTFDWLLCHLSFVCCLIIFWLQIELVDNEDLLEDLN